MKKVDSSNVHAVLSKYILADGMKFVVDLKKSHGSWLYDSKENKEYLDFFTFFASLPIGFNHPELLKKDFINKLINASINKPSNSDLYTVEMTEFVQTFAEICCPKDMKNLFFIDGGGLAVENALKTAMDWKIRKNMKKGKKGEKGRKIIHFMEAFHGRTGYTLSLTNTADPRKHMYFTKFDWPRILNPKVTFPLNAKNLETVRKLEKESLNQINGFIKEEGDDIAGLIIEPIQGEGGDNHFRAEFFQKLREITLDKDIIFILDEVQSGMGLTGKWWAFEHYGFKPDIVCFGKKSQTCGIIASDRIKEVEKNVFEESSRLNSTWGGNLTDMVRSQKYIEIIKQEKLVDNAAKMGKYLLAEIEGLQKKYPKLVSNVRGKGLMIAFDLDGSEKRNKAIDIILNEKIIVLPCGNKSIRLRPPLNINKKECDIALKAFESSFKKLK